MDQGFSGFGGRGDKFGPPFMVVILNGRQEPTSGPVYARGNNYFVFVFNRTGHNP